MLNIFKFVFAIDLIEAFSVSIIKKKSLFNVIFFYFRAIFFYKYHRFHLTLSTIVNSLFLCKGISFTSASYVKNQSDFDSQVDINYQELNPRIFLYNLKSRLWIFYF